MSLDRYGTPSMAEAAQALLSVGPSARGFGEACFAAVSIDGSIVTANRPFCELFGYDVNELVGQSSHILNGDDDPAADRAAARLVRGVDPAEGPSFIKTVRGVGYRMNPSVDDDVA